MKFTYIVACLLSVGAAIHINNDAPVNKPVSTKEFPEKLGDKNSETTEKTWMEYVAGKKDQPNNCHLNEKLNWYGNHRCTESFECQGARVCEGQVHLGKDLKKIGWCVGPDACPYVGPLDQYKQNKSDISASTDLKLNPGGAYRTDASLQK